MTQKTIIIAEAGVNHNGNFENAIKLIEKAAEAGADYVKFQTFKADNLVTKSAKKAAYQEKNVNDGDDSQYLMLKKLEMPFEWHYKLQKHAVINGIKFLSTGFDEESIDFLDSLGIDLYKIPSGEITNKHYLQHIAKKGKPIIISTGMSTMDDIKAAVKVICDQGIRRSNVIVLHCNTEYPTPMMDVNLKAMESIKNEIGVEVGYSDHTLGIEVPIAAVALGATVIEKHFTLDKNLPGPDHLASLEPSELKEMISAIRNIEKAISGDSKKKPSNSELKNIQIVRKSLHYSKSRGKGHIIQEHDLVALRPGNGISPMEIDNFIGKELLYDVTEFTQVEIKHFK